jgi:hypothetical protein
LHPRYLDAKGLVALWRESLLARAVLSEQTKGYRHHPQLLRFLNCPEPIAAINVYLLAVHEESEKRGYHFDAGKLGRKMTRLKLFVSDGQMTYEWERLKAKVKIRDPQYYKKLKGVKQPQPHPLFKVRAGTIETWERMSDRLPF